MRFRYLCTTRSTNNGVSSNVTDPVRELKRHVHRLYKHIHPDRLGQHPTERSINESSFQVLQSALERHFSRMQGPRGDNNFIPPQAPQRPQKLVFFSKDNEKQLAKAVVDFHESTLGKTLHSLFESLSLEPPPKHVLPSFASATNNQNIQFSSLSQLMRHARQVAMQNTGKRHTTTASSTSTKDAPSASEQEVLVTRLALQRSRGITITLGTGLPAESKLVGVFRRLNTALRDIRDIDLSTMVIELNGGFDVSLNDSGIQPWLSLGVCAPADRWDIMLTSQQLHQACRKCRHETEAIREAEALAAVALGVRLVMHDITLVDQERFNGDESENPIQTEGLENFLARSKLMKDYAKLLEQIISDWRTNMSNTTVSDVKPLAVMITTTADQNGNGTSTDIDHGLLRIPLSASAKGVNETLRRDGPGLAVLYEEKTKRIEMERALVSRIRASLQLGGLRRAVGLEDKLYIAALHRLRENGGKLKGVFDGAAIVIGTQARLLIDTDEVEIPHDFHIRMPI